MSPCATSHPGTGHPHEGKDKSCVGMPALVGEFLVLANTVLGRHRAWRGPWAHPILTLSRG